MGNAPIALDCEAWLQVPNTAALLLQECELKPFPNQQSKALPFFSGCTASSHTRNAPLQTESWDGGSFGPQDQGRTPALQRQQQPQNHHTLSNLWAPKPFSTSPQIWIQIPNLVSGLSSRSPAIFHLHISKCFDFLTRWNQFDQN